MIQVLIVAAGLMGPGSWYCEYSHKYPEHNLSETFFSTISYSENLTFEAKTEILYQRIGRPEIIGKVISSSNGITIMNGETFTHSPNSVSVDLVFDNFNGLSGEYLEYLKEYLSKPGYNLKVESIGPSSMKILHLDSGTITDCSKVVLG
jgi:hypothetical protein